MEREIDNRFKAMEFKLRLMLESLHMDCGYFQGDGQPCLKKNYNFALCGGDIVKCSLREANSEEM